MSLKVEVGCVLSEDGKWKKWSIKALQLDDSIARWATRCMKEVGPR